MENTVLRYHMAQKQLTQGLRLARQFFSFVFSLHKRQEIQRTNIFHERKINGYSIHMIIMY